MHDSIQFKYRRKSDYHYRLIPYFAYFSDTMNKHDSSLSKEQFNLLKDFKKQITNPHSTAIKQSEVQAQVAPPEPEDDFALFQKQMQGVQKMETANIAKIEKNPKKKIDAQTLAKRAAAEGPMHTDATELSDTQSDAQPCSEPSQRLVIALLRYNTKYLKI